MRAIAMCAVLAACGRPEAPPAIPRSAAARTPPAKTAAGPIAAGDPRAAAPGLRLVDGVVPLAYDVTLELDPARDAFTGHVVISIAVATPGATQLWLHAADLAITRARVRSGGRDHDVELLTGGGPDMRGFALPGPVGGDPIALAIDYTGRVHDMSGHAGKEEQGLFRQQEGGRWYLFSQSESIFARRIVPCFDEPRFKPAWRVTAIVPRELVALANGPVAAERVVRDGRREVRFAEVARMPSYLLAVAVGPFDVVDVGRLGRAQLPVRLAVAKGDGKRVGFANRMLPKLVDALETYVGSPLPAAKLDLVAVPRFFGAMENLGLITFDSGILVDGRDFIRIAAHELAHHWFGNSVTPAWWDHLWLSEAFSSWLGERTATSLGAALPPPLAHGSRLSALRADEEIDARPLVRPIVSADDIEPAFDAIAYEKGAEVLATFERFVGEVVFQDAIRAYLSRHAGSSVTSQAFVDALAAATSPAVGDALASNLAHAGMPVVELELRCTPPTAGPAGRGRGAATPVGPVGSMSEARSRGVGTPTAGPAGRGGGAASPVGSLAASARAGVAVPVCVLFPLADDTTRACFLVGPRSELALPAGAGCPAWVIGNDGGRGYYQTVWRGGAPHAPVALLSPEERLARGDDAAAGVRHGDLAIGDALAELTTLAATRDPNAEMAALSIAQAIDPLVADPVRPAWAAWLAARFPGRLTPAILSPSKSMIEQIVRIRLVRLAGAAVTPATLGAARKAIERKVDTFHDATRLRLAAIRDPGPLFDRFVQTAAATKREALRGHLLRSLGDFPGEIAPRLIDVMLDPRFARAQVWPALATMLERGDGAAAAWRALHARFAEVLDGLAGPRAPSVIAATGSLCDASARAEVAADFAPRVAAIAGGERALAGALAAIDRCITRRAAAGDIARALAAAPTAIAAAPAATAPAPAATAPAAAAPASGALTTPP